MLSYQSPMPAAAGTPRYENGTWLLEVFGCGWCHPSPLDSRFRENDELGGRNDEAGAGGIQALLRLRSIIFVPMTMWSSPTLVRRRPASAWLTYTNHKRRYNITTNSWVPGDGNDASHSEMEIRMGTRLKDKVALITGGGGGIGEATAQLFWEEGARVAIVDVNARDAENASRGIDAGGERLLAIGADLAVEEEARRAVQETVSAFGGLHVLANVAGVRIPQGTVADLTAEAWEFIIGANLMSAVYCSKYAVPEIAKVGGGSIVHVSSSGAITPRSGWAPYDATKSALLALTQDMAWDHAGQSIRVNAVCPGSTLTRFHIRNRARIKNISYEQARDELRAAGGPNLMNRQADPRELAYAILFLACEESSFVTGATFRIDGGLPYSGPSGEDPIPRQF